MDKNINEENINNKQDKSKFNEDIKHYEKVKKLINDIKDIQFYDLNVFKKYGKKTDNKSIYDKKKKSFDHIRLMKSLLMIVFIIAVFASIFAVINSNMERANFRVISNNTEDSFTIKDEIINKVTDKLNKQIKNNNILSVDNLNMAYLYGKTFTEDMKENQENTKNTPVPTVLNTETVEEIEVNPNSPMESVAGKAFTKLMDKYRVFENSLYNLADIQPEIVARQNRINVDKIMGDFNPDDKNQIFGDKYTYKVPNFTHVNINYFDGDGNELSEYNNVKDIISMASVFTYYHDPYDYNTFLDYCYNLFNNSLSYKIEISDLYHCSGCTYFDESLYGELKSTTSVTTHKIKKNLNEQEIKNPDYKKTGRVYRTDIDKIDIKEPDYDNYINSVESGETLVERFNYCPGHLDLDINVTTLSLYEKRGLVSLDAEYGNNEEFYNEEWSGWDLLKIIKARNISNEDWDEKYGIAVSYIQYIKPLTQEEVNYYLSRLDKNISEDRFRLIETALKSVARIPYYYGGKPIRKGYINNNFGSKVKADYKGRVLKGLDCSGWVTWVYWTTFDKKLVQSEGTNKLALEGVKIRRYELLPGDLIVRPGYDSHVMMFLEWAENGKMRVIHENGSVDNVSVGTFEAYYPNYRRILKD